MAAVTEMACTFGLPCCFATTRWRTMTAIRMGMGSYLTGSLSTRLLNNLVIGNDYGIRSTGSQPDQLSRNCFYDNRLGNYTGITQGTDDFSANPMLINGAARSVLPGPVHFKPGQHQSLGECRQPVGPRDRLEQPDHPNRWTRGPGDGGRRLPLWQAASAHLVFSDGGAFSLRED